MISLERYLAELPSASDKLGTVANIQNVVFHEISFDDHGMAAYVLFSPNSKVSVLKYLEHCVTNVNEPLYKEREALLAFIEQAFDAMKEKLADYAVDIKAVCLKTYRCDHKSNTLRAAALQVILRIVTLGSPALDAERLGIAEVARVVNADISGSTSKLGVGLRSVLLRLLGAVAERFPGAVMHMMRQLMALFMDTMAEVAASKSPELAVMAAALDGLSGVLVHARGDFCANQQYRQLVYFYMSRGMVPLEGVARYELPRACLRMMHKHAEIFAEFLTVDCVKVFECFTAGNRALCRHSNRDVRTLAFKAMDSFMREVSGQLCSGKRSQQTDVADFTYFVKKFFELMQSELDSRSEISIAVSGFGAFAPSIARFLGQQELKNVLAKLFQLCDRVISGHRIGESQDRAQIHLGSFILTFANLVMQMDELDDASLLKLAQLLRKLFDVYPLMFPKQKKLQVFAVSQLFVALYSKGSCLRTLMAEVAKQCLFLTCSSAMDFSRMTRGRSDAAKPDEEKGSASGLTASEARRFEASTVAGKPWVTYLPLWRVMLKPKTLVGVDFPEDFTKEVSAVVYDELLRAIMSLLSTLNLSYIPVAEAEVAEEGNVEPAAASAAAARGGAGSENHSDKGASSTANENAADAEGTGSATDNLTMRYPADHEILQNLVSFCEDLLQSSHQNLFCRRWVFLFGEQLIQASSAFPLVASFYRLMAVVFRVCEDQRYFQGLQTDSATLLSNVAETARAHAAAANELVSASGMAVVAAATRDVTFLLFSKFVNEILSRSQQFKDELLVAAVTLLLAVPREFLNPALMMPSLELAFRMGLSYEPLARLGLDALEHWMQVAAEKIVPHLSKVLPLLGDFLTSETKASKEGVLDAAGTADDWSDEVSSIKIQFRIKGARTKGKASISRKTVSLDIQHRILGVLGMMGGLNEALLSGTSFDVDQSMAWDTVKRIKFKVPLPDLMPVIYMDEILPRIVFLAESSPDRRTKVAACELLHALMLYMIGMNSSDPSKDKAGGERSGGTNFSKLYQHVFPAMLRLATDLDVVPKQLFYTLTFQCINWFTGNKTPESPETMALLSAIVEAVGDEHSSGLRVFGARCVGEFFRCSQRRGQTDPLSAAGHNFKSLLQRVYSLAHQPSAFARLGAAMAFGQIYREFRTNVKLVREHVMDMLYEMLQSLRVAHRDPPSVGTADRAAVVVRQLARIACKYGYKLLRATGHLTARFHSMDDFVTFLSKEIASRETMYRKECMALLADFVQMLPAGRDGPHEWLASHRAGADGGSFLRTITETNLRVYLESASPDHLASEDGIAGVSCFFEYLAACLESLGWLVRHEFVQKIESHLASDQTTCVFRAMFKLLSSFGLDVPALRSLTPHEQSQYRELFARALLRSFRFLLLLAEKVPVWFQKSQCVEQLTTATPHFYTRLFESILDPVTASAGVDDLYKSFPVYTSALLKLLVLKPKEQAVAERCMQERNVFAMDPAHPATNLQTASNLVAGYRRIVPWAKQLLQREARRYAVEQSSKYSAPGAGMTPAQSLVAVEMMTLALELEAVAFKDVLMLLLRAEQPPPGSPSRRQAGAGGDAGTASRATSGALWYEFYQEPLDRFLLSHWDGLGDRVIAQMKTVPVMMQVVFSLLKKCGMRVRHAAPKALPFCRYGALCYRFSPSHRSKYFHPSGESESEDASQQNRVIQSAHAAQAEQEHWTESFKPAFVSQICNRLEELAGWAREEADLRSKESLLNLLHELLRLDAHKVLESRSRSRSFCVSVAVKFLGRSLPKTFKNRALSLMGPLLKYLPENEVADVIEGLRSMVVYDFPLSSRDMVENSPAYNDYVQSIEALMTLLRESGNLKVLEILYPVLGEANHRHRERINQLLSQFVGSLEVEKAKKVFEMCYRALMDPLHQHMLQYVLVTRLCLPILLEGEPDIVQDLFVDYVVPLVENVPQEANVSAARRGADPGPAKRHHSSDPTSSTLEHNIVVQVCSFDLLREFYKLVPRDNIHGMVNTAYLAHVDPKKKVNGNELTIRVSSAAYNAKVLQPHKAVRDSVGSHLLRQYHQSAFNCLAAVVICTQQKEDLYASLILEEKSKKGEVFWGNVIETDMEWRFEVDTDYLVIKKAMAEVRPENDLLVGGSRALDPATHRIKLMERFIGSSSLGTADGFYVSEKTGGFDNCGSSGGGGDASLSDFAPSPDAAASKQRKANGPRAALARKEEEYEFDVINANPCMPTILFAIDVLFEKFKYNNYSAMPPWMSNLVRVLENATLHPNIRLFVGKIFVNRQTVFAPWGQRFLMGPLLRLCNSIESMSYVRDTEPVEKCITYYLRDMCIMLLKFGKPAPELHEEASRFVNEMVVKKIATKNSTVLKENVRLFGIFYTQWDGCFSLNKQLLISMLAQQHVTYGAMMRSVGLQLISLMLDNNHLPVEPVDKRRDDKLDEMELYRQLLSNLDHKSSRIYLAAAEVSGELLETLRLRGLPAYTALKSGMTSSLQNMFAKKDLDRAIQCLQLIVDKSPDFADPFFGKIFDVLGILVGVYKSSALEIIEKRAATVPNLQQQLRHLMVGLLENREPRTQLLALQLTRSLIPTMDESFLTTLLRPLSAFPAHTSVECRRVAYEIFMAIFDYRESLQQDALVRVTLLKGLSDPEEKLQLLPGVTYSEEDKQRIEHHKPIGEMVQEFWNDPRRLSDSSLNRLSDLLQTTYEPDIENEWLSFAPAMLLQLCSKSQAYRQKLFDYPLEQGAQFVEVRIATHSATLGPVGGRRGGAGGGFGGSSTFGMTQKTLGFAPSRTVMTSQDGEYLSMDQFVSSARADGHKDFMSAAFGDIQWTPSLSEADPAVDTKKRTVKSAFKMQELPGMPQSEVNEMEGQDRTSVDDRHSVYRRFRKTNQTMSSSFDMSTYRKLKQQYAIDRRVQETLMAGLVPLTRTYLMGELPNIGITPEEIIAPLCSIASRDKTMSSVLLAVVIDGMINAVPHASRESLQKELRGLIESCLERTAFNGAFVSCLLRVCVAQPGLVLDDRLVGSCALKSASYHSGALVLEKQIEGRRKIAAPASKRRRKEDSHLERDNNAELGWKPLAVLYKVLGDEDVLTGISDKHLAQHSYTHDAIHKELEGDFEGALALYSRGADAADDPAFDWGGNVPLKEELDLWEDGRLECLANLTRWSDLVDAAKTEVDSNLENLWVNDMESYRTLYVHGGFRMQSEWGALNEFVDASLNNEEHGKWLLRNFGPQLALLSLVRDDFDRAGSFASQSAVHVLESWRSLHPLARKGRVKLLQSLQLLKELREVIDFTRSNNNFKTMQPLTDLLERWSKRWPLEMTGVVVWDMVAYSRDLLLDKLTQRFEYREAAGQQQQQYGMQWGAEVASRERVELAVADARIANWRRCTRAGLKQRNVAVALAFHERTGTVEAQRAAMTGGGAAVGLADFPSLCMLAKLFEQKSRGEPQLRERVKLMANALSLVRDKKGFPEELLSTVPHTFVKYHRLSAKLYMSLYDLVTKVPSKDTNAAVEYALSEQALPGKPTAASFMRECLKMAYKHLTYAHKNAGKDPDVTYRAKTFMHMARFCDRMLGENENRDADAKAKYARHIIEPILDATALNLREASDMLPKVIVLMSEYRDKSEVKAAFQKGVAACPSWMFIRWVSYLLANLSDQYMAALLMPLLTKLAQDYPMAIYYPFHLSANPKFLSDESSALVRPLRQLLKSFKLEELMDQLMLLQHPEHRFQDWLAEFRRVRKKAGAEGTPKAALADWKRFAELTLSTTNLAYGTYNAKFAAMYRDKIVKLVGGEDGHDLIKRGYKDDELAKLSSHARDVIPNKNSTRVEELAQYSRGLTEFSYQDVPAEERYLFEVPGQYENLFGKPDPETHVRISSFGDKILSMGSLRKPKKLTMIGTDQKPYPWLVKGGEDLRQDQRIEQLWHLMNDLLRANTSTSARGLLLETYKVVPMSLQLGLVEWVEGTTPLKGIIEDQLKSDGGPRQIGEMPANRLHTQWLDKFVPKDPKRVNDAHGNYHEMIVSATRANALAKWDKQMQETDQTLLRRGIASIARSPESYLCLRNGFARSLACVSVCGYVAGIGDRHLDNFLVHNSTGFIIAIDFGHAFGSATFSLPIPELVPFRLSPQLVTFLEPIGPQGLLAHNMTHVLSSLVQNKEQLLNLMEVFIKEPHMDWIKHAEKNVTSSHTGQSNQNNSSGGGGGGAGGSSAGGGGGGSMSGVVVGTFAERRLKMVRDKLELRNPAFVTCDELDESAQRATRGPMIEKMKEYTKGYREFNFRARVGDRCATVAEQVEALIDMASDANILARSWQGWSSFC